MAVSSIFERMDSRMRAIKALSLSLALVCSPLWTYAASAQATSRAEDEAAVARFYLQSGRWREARDAYEKLTLQPNAPASSYSGLGEAYMQLGERERAVAAFEAALKRQPDVHAQRRLVDLLSQSKEGWPRATEILKAYLEQRPDDVARRSQLADLLISQSRIREAIPQLAEIVQARPQDADRRLLYARSLAWNGQSKEAQDHFARALAGGVALQGEDLKLVALAEEAGGKHAAAYGHFKSYVEAHPDDADALAGLGRTANMTRNYDDVDRVIQRLREMSVRRPDLAVTIARLEVNRGRREAALPEYERALELSSDPALAKEYADIQGSLVKKQGQAGKKAAAVAVSPLPLQPAAPVVVPENLPKLIAPKPAPVTLDASANKTAAAVAALASAQMKAGNLDAAAATLEQAGTLVDQRADLLALRGGIAFAQGNPEAAEQDYQAALKLKPQHLEATKGLAAVYAARGEYSRAESLLPSLKRRARRDYDRLRKEIAQQRKSQQLETKIERASDESSEALLRKAVAQAPERVDYRLRLAQLLERSGRGNEALPLYMALRSQQPDLREAYLGPVRVYIAQGDEKNARAGFEEFQRLFPGEENAVRVALLSVEAEEHKRAGNYKESVDSYRNALKLAPNDAKLWNGLAGSYFAARQLPDALHAFQAAGKADPDDVDAANGQVDVLATMASDALGRGEQDATRRYVAQALQVKGGSAQSVKGLIEMSMTSGDYESAQLALERLPNGDEKNRLRQLVDVERQLQPWRNDPDNANPREVLSLAERGLSVAPRRDDLMLVRAQALERLGESDRALSAYRKLREGPTAMANAPSEAAIEVAKVVDVTEKPSKGRKQKAGKSVPKEKAPPAVVVESSPPAPELPAEPGRARDVGYTLAEAAALQRAGKLDEAIHLVHQALDQDPENVNAQLALGGLYSQQQEYGLAIAAYEAARARRPHDAFVTNALAGAYFSNGDLEQARALYDSVLDEYPSNPEALRGNTNLLLAIAGRHLSAQELEAADAAIEQVLERDPNNAEALSMRAQIALAGQDWERARVYARQLPDAAQGQKISETLSIQERLAQWREDPSTMSARSALQLAKRGRELDPYRGDFAYDEARAAELVGDHSLALSSYRRLAEAPDASAEAYAGQVRALTAMKRYSEAEQALTAYSAAHPEAANRERANLRRAQAGALLDSGRTNEAFFAAREALALDPEDADSLKVIAGVYSKQGQFQDAIDTHRAVLAANPDDPGSLQGIAGAYEGVGDWQAAEATYRRLDTIPGYEVSAETWNRIAFHRDMEYARQLIEAGRFADARDLMEQLRERNPRDPDVWAGLSEVTLETGADTLALTYAEQGLALNRSSARLQAARIRALSKLGRYADARQAIANDQRTLGAQTAAELARDVRRAQDRIDRERLTREGRLDQVYLLLAQDYRSDPNDVDTLKSIGFLYLQTKQYVEAEQFFSRAQALAPEDGDVRLGLAYALRGSGNTREALDILEDQYEASKDPELGLALAEMYHDMGRDGDASAILEEAGSRGGVGVYGLPPQPGSGYASSGAVVDSILPPLKLPQGTLRAKPAPVDALPPRRWQGSRATARLTSQPLAAAATDSMNDAAPAAAAMFSGGAVEALRAWAAHRERDVAEAQIAEDLPSFERIMRDVRAKGRSGKATAVPTRVPTPRGWQEPRIETTPVPRLATPARRQARSQVPAPVVYEDSLPPVRLEWERRHDPSTQGVPRYSDLSAIQYETIPEEVEAPPVKALSPEARLRAERLARDLARKQAVKVGLGFRYDFLSAVADWRADQFAIYRFPMFVDLPAALNTRFRLTAEPTLVDNGDKRDAGVSGMATLNGLALGTDAIVLSGGVGGTPWGFPRRPYLTGFAQLDLKPAPWLTLTPFYERQPVMESMLSFRGQKLVSGNSDTFIGKVIQDRFGGRIGFTTPALIDGVLELAYSTLQGIRIPDNEKFDGFLGVGRTFELRNYDNQIRPGVELAFFHYDKDLSEPVRGSSSSDADLIAAVNERRTGGGYFSPDAFVQALLRLDFTGPFFPDTLDDATFLVTGKVGGQWISGVDSDFFEDAEGSRIAGGIEGTLNFPIEEIAVLTTSAGGFWADPYNRHFFLVNLVFPLAF